MTELHYADQRTNVTLSEGKAFALLPRLQSGPAPPTPPRHGGPGMTALLLDLASRFRLARRPGGYGGDCPACGYADAFTARTTREGRTALHCFNGCDRDALHDAARCALGSGWMPPPRPDAARVQANRQSRQNAAQRLWQRSHPCPGTLAETYLARRGIGHAATSSALRFQADCPHPGGTRLPALVSAVRNGAGAVVAVQRTYLASDGLKAAVDPARATLGPVWGAAVQLNPCGPELAVGEGMESSASAGLIFGLPAWAALSAGNLAALVLPLEVRRVLIAVDYDRPGRDAAAVAQQRWLAEGRTVRLAMPNTPGTDLNDLVQAGLTAVPHG